jgi:RHS repeat-associated protein
VELDSRTVSVDGYRFGYSGNSIENEILDSRNLYDFGERLFYPNLGLFLTRDVYQSEYPMYNSYGYAANSPLALVDKNGQFIGTIVGAVVGGVISAVKGENVWKGVVTGAIAGAVSDVIIFTCGTGAVAILSAGAVSGAVGNTAEQMIIHGKSIKQLNKKEIAYSAGFGALIGYIGSKIASSATAKVFKSSKKDPLVGIVKGGTIDDYYKSLELLKNSANEAVENVGPGKGPIYGTKIHKEFESIVDEYAGNLSTEVSYFEGKVVPHGTKGSVRLDVVLGDINNPSAIFDLKTGGASLTNSRIKQIRNHLPIESKKIPIEEIKINNSSNK